MMVPWLSPPAPSDRFRANFAPALPPTILRMLGRPKLVLASGSPRRLSLLNQAGIEPDALRPADVEYWPTPDPVGLQGSREQQLDAYRNVRDGLMDRIRHRFAPGKGAT